MSEQCFVDYLAHLQTVTMLEHLADQYLLVITCYKFNHMDFNLSNKTAGLYDTIQLHNQPRYNYQYYYRS